MPFNRLSKGRRRVLSLGVGACSIVNAIELCGAVLRLSIVRQAGAEMDLGGVAQDAGGRAFKALEQALFDAISIRRIEQSIVWIVFGPAFIAAMGIACGKQVFPSELLRCVDMFGLLVIDAERSNLDTGFAEIAFA